jgi:integrase
MKGHLRERSPGHWAIVIDVRDPQTGKRRRRWHSFKGTKREAQTRCAQLIAELETGTNIDPARISVAAYLDRWLAHMRTQISPRSYELYGESIANIVPHIGHFVLSKLQPDAIAVMYATALDRGGQRGEGLAPSSVKMMHGLLVQAFRQAVKWQLIARNPVDAVSAPRVERRQMCVLNTDGAAAYLAAARGHELFVPIMLGVLCGLRRGEIAALRWRDVDLDVGRLAVTGSIEQTAAGVRRKAPKSGRSRVIALPAIAIEELRRHRLIQAEALLGIGIRQSDDSPICLRANLQRWTPLDLSNRFIKFVKAAGLPRVRLHDLRHSHATHLLMAGVHPKVTQERLGHSSIMLTMDLYSHVLPAMQDEAARSIDAVMRAAISKRRE